MENNAQTYNKENVLKLADLIDQQPESKFDIARISHNCGSPSCIAGWAAWEQQGRPKVLMNNGQCWNGENNLINDALDFFGTDDKDGSIRQELFRGGYTGHDNFHITKDMSVRTLRHFAETGEINWFEFDDF